jgi:hypothetical protein
MHELGHNVKDRRVLHFAATIVQRALLDFIDHEHFIRYREWRLNSFGLCRLKTEPGVIVRFLFGKLAYARLLWQPHPHVVLVEW